jgi:hypothetical protein
VCRILAFQTSAVLPDTQCKYSSPSVYTAEKLYEFNKSVTESFRSAVAGDLERLRRFWFTGACNKPMNKEKHSRSDPLALEQFFSTFLLLGSGILLAIVLLLLERAYCKCRRPINTLLHFDDQTSNRAAVVRGCCSLLSRVRPRLIRTTKTTVFCDLAPRSLVNTNRRLKGAYCLQHQSCEQAPRGGVGVDVRGGWPWHSPGRTNGRVARTGVRSGRTRKTMWEGRTSARLQRRGGGVWERDKWK